MKTKKNIKRKKKAELKRIIGNRTLFVWWLWKGYFEVWTCWT